MIEFNSIEDVDILGEKYDVDILVTRNTDFEQYIAIVLYDEEIKQQYVNKKMDSLRSPFFYYNNRSSSGSQLYAIKYKMKKLNNIVL